MMNHIEALYEIDVDQSLAEVLENKSQYKGIKESVIESLNIDIQRGSKVTLVENHKVTTFSDAFQAAEVIQRLMDQEGPVVSISIIGDETIYIMPAKNIVI